MEIGSRLDVFLCDLRASVVNSLEAVRQGHTVISYPFRCSRATNDWPRYRRRFPPSPDPTSSIAAQADGDVWPDGRSSCDAVMREHVGNRLACGSLIALEEVPHVVCPADFPL